MFVISSFWDAFWTFGLFTVALLKFPRSTAGFCLFSATIYHTVILGGQMSPGQLDLAIFLVIILSVNLLFLDIRIMLRNRNLKIGAIN